MTDPTTIAPALEKLSSLQDVLDGAEATATKAADQRNQAMLEAQEAGATWPQIEKVTGLSNTRVGQLLRKAKRTT